MIGLKYRVGRNLAPSFQPPETKLHAPKYWLKNHMVEKFLRQGKSCNWIAGYYGVGESLIQKIKAGTRRDPPDVPKHREGNNDGPLCSCCFTNRVKKGNRFLCESCFKSGSTGDTYYDATCYLSL